MSTPAETSLLALLRHVAGLSAIAGYVEAIGFSDFSGIYPGIMTGNTVQFGLTFAKAQWALFGTIGLTIGLFFVGGILASLVRWHLRRPPLELLLMAALLIVAGFVRLLHPAQPMLELPLLVFSMAMQGETISRFGGVSLQTIVVTNNLLKFSDALVGRYLISSARHTPRAGQSQPATQRPELKEVLMPGFAWLSYGIGAAAGAVLIHRFWFPLAVPAVLLALMVCDLMATRPHTADAFR
jgi:uncharacterized membrane protein YoaK (UPF0700 family)